jgi:ATPase family associated with various cellular activities (AAA)
MRSDLLIQLVQSGSKGDKTHFNKVVEAVIAEERAKQHNMLADKLQENFLGNKNNLNGNFSVISSPKGGSNSETYLMSGGSSISFNDLILSKDLEYSLRQIIEEQHRADILRSYNLEPRNKVLLVGLPGNGKTSIAEAVARELMLPFYTVKYESLISSYLGEIRYSKISKVRSFL